MYLKKNFVSLILVSLMIFTACKNDSDSNSNKDEVVLDKEDVLSTNLVNNPTSSDQQIVDPTQTGLLVFADTVHDFGTIAEGEVIQYEFDYTNKGSKEVIIVSAKGSCGCTVPEYETDPIKPGETGIMKVTFDSDGKAGYNEKSVQITTNGVPSKYRLTILATVTKK